MSERKLDAMETAWWAENADEFKQVHLDPYCQEFRDVDRCKTKSGPLTWASDKPLCESCGDGCTHKHLK